MVIKSPKAASAAECLSLEQLPNVGPAIAADLRLIGIERPADLRDKDAWNLYRALCEKTGRAPGPLRPRHPDGRHRLHARRAGRAVVEVHGRAQGDLRRRLGPAAPRAAGFSARNWWVAAALFAASSQAPTTTMVARPSSAMPCDPCLPPSSSACSTASCLRPPPTARRRARKACRRWLRRRTVAWVRRLGERSRSDALAAARLDFDEALGDIRTPAAINVRSRIAVARSLHELWHFREEVFSLVVLPPRPGPGGRPAGRARPALPAPRSQLIRRRHACRARMPRLRRRWSARRGSRSFPGSRRCAAAARTRS